jgi:hypothetical protein
MVNTLLRESTKFRIVPAPTQEPGICISCGSSRTDDRDYIDFGLDKDFLGTVYFCTFCMTECANTIGYINPEQARRLEEQVEYYATKVANFYTKDRALNDAINLLRDSGLFDLTDGAANTSNEVLSSQVDGSSEQDNHGTNESDQHIKQQDSQQGPIDLSAAGNNELRNLGLEL